MVIAIIGISVAIGIPLAAEQMRQAKMRGAADQLAMDLRDHPGDEGWADHPSHDARDAEQQGEGEDQLARAVSGQLGRRYTFRFLGWA